MIRSNFKKYCLKLLTFIIFIGLVIFIYFNGGKDFLDFSFLQNKLGIFKDHYQNAPLKTALIFFGIYLGVTALSFPGASVLTLLAGALFDPWIGLLIVSFASTFGSFLAFLVSRFLLRDILMQKFRKQFNTIDEKIKNDGAVYLATLRLVPIFPFFVVNLIMGLTAIGSWTFLWISQISMLPGTAVFVYAGKKFSELDSLKGIMSAEIIAVLMLLGMLPLMGKYITGIVTKHRIYKKFKKPKVFEYNLVAIGGGSAGLVTTYIGAAVKSKVALIEKSKMGGDCLNTGCVPSKALIKSAKIIHYQKRAQDFGLLNVKIDFTFSSVMERVQRVIKEIGPHDSMERYNGLGVDCILGEARLLSPWEIQVGDKKITTKNIVIATGAGPLIPNIPGIENAHFVTSENMWDIRELPKRFVIIGGGPIGSEMAQAFSRLGSVVTIVEGTDRLLFKEDIKVSHFIGSIFEQEGIRVLTSHKVVRFSISDQEKVLICETNGNEIQIPYDLVLMAIGRKAHTKNLGLQELGIKLRENGTIDVNENQQSSIPNIYACGDVAGPYQLTHMAAHQAWYCAINALFPVKFKIDYSVVPWCTYTDPEIATVGETEISATEKKLEFEVTEYDLSDLDRAIAEDEKKGMVRVITEKGKDKILGATIVSTHASSMILEYVSAMKNKKGLSSILGTIHVYPSFGEANKYAAGAWKKNHTNPNVLKFLEKYFKWKRI